MNRSDLAKSMAYEFNITQKEADDMIVRLFAVVELSLKCDEPVLISGFGKFFPRRQKATTKKNPKTGDVIEIPEKRTVAFHASSRMKKRIA